MDADSDPKKISMILQEEGVSYSFANGFQDKIIDKLFLATSIVNREIDFLRYMNFAFNRIAVSAAAAILALIISIWLKEGSLSLNTFFGIGDSYDESIICMLTGK